MKCTCLIACIILATQVVGQRPDSLWQVYNETDKPVEDRLEAIHKLGRHFMYQNPDTSIYYAKLEYALAESENDHKWMANALNIQGIASTVSNDFVAAIDRFSRSLDLNIGIGDSVATASAYNNIGNVHYYKGNYATALQYFIQSSDLEERIGNCEGLAGSHLNIGSLYARQKEHLSALDYFNRALEYYLEVGDSIGKANCYVNIGTAYNALNDTRLAITFLKKGIQILEVSEQTSGLAAALANLASLLAHEGRVDSAELMFQRCEKIRRDVNDKIGLSSLLITKGKTYNFLGRHRDARRNCMEGLSIAESLEVRPEVSAACNCLYTVYKALGDETSALEYYERANRVEREMNDEETVKQLQLMEFKRQVARDSLKREREKAELENEMRKVRGGRDFYLVLGAGLLLLTMILYMIIRRVRKSRSLIAIEKDKSEHALHSVLPGAVAKELRETGGVQARQFEDVTVIFTDLIGFTHSSENMRPQDLVDVLNEIFVTFDEIVQKHGIQKIKTMGDGYIAAGGLPVFTAQSISKTVDAAMEMQAFIEQRAQKRKESGKEGFQMRVGIHHGPVIAGIVGTQNIQYDIWGDTVNTASRIETSGQGGRVNISQSVYRHIASNDTYTFESRGLVHVKGKGDLEMWFVDRRKE